MPLAQPPGSVWVYAVVRTRRRWPGLRGLEA